MAQFLLSSLPHDIVGSALDDQAQSQIPEVAGTMKRPKHAFAMSLEKANGEVWALIKS